MTSDEKDSPGVVTDSDCLDEMGLGSPQPMYMQLFSTWDVRKAPVNCVPRSVMMESSTFLVKK